MIQYYHVEKDIEYFYIALELCDATLDKYVSGMFAKELIKPLDILEQVTRGLKHLHSLKIGKKLHID